MRCVRVLVVMAVLAGARAAAAHPMQHFDLAGLVQRSDAIVFADRVKIDAPSRYSRIGHYRVTRVVRGKLAIGDEVAVEEFLYDDDRVKLDKPAVLFLDQRDGKLELMSSGLRVVQGGKVYRFEQWNNPGGWSMVPQGDDPTDIWNGTAAPIDLPTFARELDAAQHRVDALAAALALHDRDRRRAAVLALFAPPGGGAPGGFYRDELAQNAEDALAKAGDIEGALLVRERDRSSFRFLRLAPLADLVAIARDAKRAVNVRADALAAIGDGMEYLGDADTAHAVTALLDDREPDVRAAAVELAAGFGGSSSDPKQNATMHALAKEEHAALERRYAVETDPDVLYSLVAVLEHPPARTGGPAIVARAYVSGRAVLIRVQCTRAHALVTGAHATPAAVVAVSVELTCDDKIDRPAAGSGTTPAGRYDIALEATVDGKPVTVPLGKLTVGADGVFALSR